MDTLGEKVSLGLVPRNGVVVTDVLNDLEKASSGRLMLPNLVMDMPVLVVVRLKVPPLAAGTPLVDFRLAWDAPRSAGRGCCTRRGGLPALRMGAWSALPEDSEVQMQVALLMVVLRRKGSRSSRGTRRVRGDTAIAGGVPRVVQFGATVDRDSGRGAGARRA